MELTQRQVSKILNCKPQFTLSLCKRGKLTKINRGRQSRIDSDVLNKYIAKRILELQDEQKRLLSAQGNLRQYLLTIDS